jgi:hypothetical protein
MATTTTSKTTPKKKQATHDDAHIRENSIGCVKDVPLLEENKQPQYKQKGRSTTSVEGGTIHHSHKSSSSSHGKQGVNAKGRENNEGCAGDGDDWDPP